MTQKEWEAVKAERLRVIDEALKEGVETLEELRRTLDDLRHERAVTVAVFESIKPYLVG